jgi:hypothetical protein
MYLVPESTQIELKVDECKPLPPPPSPPFMLLRRHTGCACVNTMRVPRRSAGIGAPEGGGASTACVMISGIPLSAAPATAAARAPTAEPALPSMTPAPMGSAPDTIAS